MFRTGDMALFRANTKPYDEEYREFFLKYLDRDEDGLVMAGDIPHLWNVEESRPVGPALSGPFTRFGVRKVNYDKNLVWLVKLN